MLRGMAGLETESISCTLWLALSTFVSSTPIHLLLLLLLLSNTATTIGRPQGHFHRTFSRYIQGLGRPPAHQPVLRGSRSHHWPKKS